MKNLKRALRRHQWNVKFKKRVNNWFKGRWGGKLEYKEEAYRGEVCTFLRTTGNPCNCFSCSGMNKYVREQNQYVLKTINKDLE